ncbi:hypothetical protein Tco_0333503 [Tanacetum coccineum]
MNEDYYEKNSCYDPNSFGFDQYQPPQFPINYPPQETSREILQAQEDLMEAIQVFFKEYDHITPNEKSMALLLAEERFLKIKQLMREEQNQPEVMQEMLLKLMDDLQILKGSQQEKKETAAQSCIPYWNYSMIDDEEARDNFLKDVCTFLRKFSRIPFGVTPKVILIAWESFGEIKDALMDKQYRQEDIQELMSKLLEDVRNISEEFSEYINCPSWNRPLFYFDDDDDEYTVIWRRPKAITPDEPSEEPEDPLIMGEKELSTIPEKDKSSVEDLVPIPSGSKGVSDDIYDHSDAESLLSQDIPITSPKIDFLSEEFAGEFVPIPPGMDEDEFDEEEDDCYNTTSDDDSYENIEYVEASSLNLEYDSLEEENEDQEEKEFDLEDIFQIQDVILREKLLNVHRLITNIESLKNNPTPDFVFKSPSSFPIPVVDSDSFFEESDTSLSHSAWESFGEIKDALMDKQYRQEDIQELMSKLLEDVRNISEEFSEYINCPSWNRPLFYFDDDDDEYTVIWRRPKAITPDEPSEEPEDPLIMGEKELSTIPEKDKSSVEDLVPIPSGSKGVSDDICDNDHSDAESLLSQDIPITSPKIDFLSEEFTGEFAPIPPGMDEDEFDEEEVDCYDHDISSDDDSYENIEYVEASPLNLEYDSLEEENEDQEEKEFDLEDIFQI